MNAIEQLCSKTIILQKGQLVAYGETHQLISRYLNEHKDFSPSQLWLTENVKLAELLFQSGKLFAGENLQFKLTLGLSNCRFR
jgi:ABC-type multidrug transport system ATPase subunit